MEQTPNYGNKQTKKRSITRKRQLILSVLLSASLTFNGISIIKKGVDVVHDEVVYNNSISQHYDIIKDNTYRTNDTKNVFIDAYDVAKDIRFLPAEDKEDIYHHLIGVAQHIEWNRNKNFQEIVDALNLDQLAFQNSKFPTESEFFDFLEKYGLLNEDGTIDFEAWEKHDKKVINFENDLEKAGKNK